MNTGLIIDPENIIKINNIEIDTPNLESNAVFGIFYGRKINWVNIAKEGLKQSMNPEYYKAIIIEKLNESKVTSSTYSLICPITSTKIKLPARGKHCLHITCFGLKNFL